MNNRNNISYYIRILASAYLIYLAYDLIKNVLAGGSDNPALFIGFGVAFILAALFFAVTSIKSLIKNSKESGVEDAPEQEMEELEDGQAQKELEESETTTQESRD